jgi:hypothetical protein
VQLVSAKLVAVDEGRDFMEGVLGVLFALVPILVTISAQDPEISLGNDLNDSLDVEVKGTADVFRR